MLHGSLTHPAPQPPLAAAAVLSAAKKRSARLLLDRILILKLWTYLGLKIFQGKNKVLVTFYPSFFPMNLEDYSDKTEVWLCSSVIASCVHLGRQQGEQQPVRAQGTTSGHSRQGTFTACFPHELEMNISLEKLCGLSEYPAFTDF